MRHIPSLATFAFAGLVAASAAEAAGGVSILPAPQALQSDDRPIADPAPREIVNFTGPQKPGTVIINTSERRLYFVLPDQQAIRYGVGVGRPGFEWAGVEHIARKREWPDWTPPSQMIERRPDLPRHMAGGIDNPLGARAMYLSGTPFNYPHRRLDPMDMPKAMSCKRVMPRQTTMLPGGGSWLRAR